MSDHEEVASLREYIKTCGCEDMEYPFCEAFGCSTVTPLLDTIDELRAALREVEPQLGGWREVICELEDFGPNEALAKAMLASLAQIDRAKAAISAALAGEGRDG